MRAREVVTGPGEDGVGFWPKRPARLIAGPNLLGMASISARAARLLLAVACALTGLLGVPAASASAPPVPAVVTAPPCGDVSSYQQVDLSKLPREATDTVNLIKKGGPYPYPQDGQVWDNREGALPDCGSSYYHEYTVKTPGSRDRGARRFVVGSRGEYFYTGDHYETFALTHIDR